MARVEIRGEHIIIDTDNPTRVVTDPVPQSQPQPQQPQIPQLTLPQEHWTTYAALGLTATALCLHFNWGGTRTALSSYPPVRAWQGKVAEWAGKNNSQKKTGTGAIAQPTVPNNERPKTADAIAERAVAVMRQKGYKVLEGKGNYNIIYVRGMDLDGDLNKEVPNYWNDIRLLAEVVGGKVYSAGQWAATTRSSPYYVQNPTVSTGAFTANEGQHRAWEIGTHFGSGRNPHQALVQAYGAKIAGTRIPPGGGTPRRAVPDAIGVNQHWGGDAKVVNLWAGGCLVGQTREGHRQFMATLKAGVSPKGLYYTTILRGEDLLRVKPIQAK